MKTTKNTAPTQTAAQMYATRLEDMHLLIGALQAALEMHAGEASRSPKDWSYAGDLGEKRLDLVRMVGALMGNEAALDAETTEAGMNALGLKKYA